MQTNKELFSSDLRALVHSNIEELATFIQQNVIEREDRPLTEEACDKIMESIDLRFTRIEGWVEDLLRHKLARKAEKKERKAKESS